MEKEKTNHQILPILYLDYHVFGGYGKPHHQIRPILFPDYHVFGGYGKRTYHQILPILYLDYHVFGWKRKKLITKSFSNSLSRLPHVWGRWKNLITKAFQFSFQTTMCLDGKGKNSLPNPSNSLSRLPRVWMEKEKTHHQILGGKRKNLITKSFSKSLSRLPHVWGIWKNLITKSLEGKGKTSSPNPSPSLYLDYHIFGGYAKTSSPYPWREKEKPHHQILLQFSI